MQPDFTIRPATPDDGEGIAALFMRTWRISLIDLLPEGFIDRFDHDVQKQKYAERAADPAWLLLVAEKDGKVIGMIGATGNTTPPLSYPMQIKSMYVDPDYHGHGIGTALLRVMLETLRGLRVPSVMLWCIAHNAFAGAFYERRGARRIEGVEPPEEYAAMPHVVYAWDL